jgi:hypothetical protein
MRPTKAEAELDMRQREGVEITGQLHDAYLTGPETTTAAIVAFAVNRTA